VDGAVRQADTSPVASSQTTPASLAGNLSRLAVSDAPFQTPPQFPLNIIDGGSLAPQSTIVEMKTCKLNLNIKMKQVWLQLFLSQTPHLYIGRHDKGTFTEVQKLRLDDMAYATGGAQVGLRKLVQVLKSIVELVKKEGKGRKLSLIFQSGVLKVHERLEVEDCLPRDLMLKFE
jgi:hypothetical protein